jgi:hypothetical protein
MGSSYSSGYYADEALETKKTPCLKAPQTPPKEGSEQLNVVSETHGSWPSTWEKCIYCGATCYYK